jgi:hypothetical protein
MALMALLDAREGVMYMGVWKCWTPYSDNERWDVMQLRNAHLRES